MGALLTFSSPYAPGPGFCAIVDALYTDEPGATGANRDTRVLNALLWAGADGCSSAAIEYEPGPGVIALVPLFGFSVRLSVLANPA